MKKKEEENTKEREIKLDRGRQTEIFTDADIQRQIQRQTETETPRGIYL